MSSVGFHLVYPPDAPGYVYLMTTDGEFIDGCLEIDTRTIGFFRKLIRDIGVCHG